MLGCLSVTYYPTQEAVTSSSNLLGPCRLNLEKLVLKTWRFHASVADEASGDGRQPCWGSTMLWGELTHLSREAVFPGPDCGSSHMCSNGGPQDRHRADLSPWQPGQPQSVKATLPGLSSVSVRSGFMEGSFLHAGSSCLLPLLWGQHTAPSLTLLRFPWRPK